MYIVGLTGGIGCGKSTIEKYFKDHGAAIIDTDVISHELQQPGKAGYVFIKHIFGESILNFDGSLNRDRLRTMVFNDREAKAKLEGLMTPLIYHECERRISELEKSSQNIPYVILTVPLLIPKYDETNNGSAAMLFQKLVNRILVVDCPEDVQVERVMARSKLSRKLVEKIVDAQSTRLHRLMKADDVIHNFDCLPSDHEQIINELNDMYITLAKATKTA
jgi:dephospho-CoA kinase